jgi:hypothetical protein
MTLRKGSLRDGQKPRIKLWDLGDPPEGTTLAQLQRHYLRTFENIDRWDAKRAELKGNSDLTATGQQRLALDYGFGDVMPDVLKGRRALQKASAEVASRRAQLKQPKADPADMAAALRRQELRSAMRQMDNQARDKFLKENGRLDGLDPEIRQAILEMPASLSGVPETTRDEFLRQATESLNADALEEIHTLERAIEIAASALEEGKAEIQREAVAVDPGYADVDRFEARAADAAKLEDQPWLKMFTENGVEVTRVYTPDPANPNTGGWKLPTSSQIEAGIIASSRDEFDKLKAAAPLGAFGTGDAGRAARTAFVEKHGTAAYLSRNSAG